MSQSPRPPASQRLAHIDALRGLAVLLVLASHIVEQSPASPLRTLLFRQLALGHLGVCLFFMISGYVIALSVAKTPLPTFWTRRVLRLYPPFWLSILLVLLVTALGLASPHGQDFAAAPLQTTLANLSMLPQLLGYDLLMPVYWSLAPELLFYVLVSVVAAAGLLARIRLVAALALLITLGAQLLAGSGAADIPLYLSMMFTGATLYQRDQGQVGAAQANLVLAACALVSLLHGLTNAGPWRSLVILGFAVVLTYRPAPRLLVWYGQISYSLYLLHLIVIAVIDTGAFWLDVPLWIAGSTGVAWLSYRLVERPCIGLGHRLTAGRKGAIDGERPPAVRGEAPSSK